MKARHISLLESKLHASSLQCPFIHSVRDNTCSWRLILADEVSEVPAASLTRWPRSDKAGVADSFGARSMA